MRYTIVFGLLGAYLLVQACVLGGVGWLLLWPGVSFLLLAAAYAGLGPRLLGKRRDGRIALWAVFLLLPYFLLTWGVCYAQRRLSREPCCNEIVPGLWIGRRVFESELPPKIRLVVDLTAEFSEPRLVRNGRSYLCLPILDHSVPSESELRELVDRIVSCPGEVLIHCALGHNRSALIAAAVLLRRGLAADVKQAEALVRQVRPAIRLQPAQRRWLECCRPSLRCANAD